MTQTLTEKSTKNIIVKLINSEDHRTEVTPMIDEEFLKYCVAFFKKIVGAKLRNKDIDIHWYEKEFLNEGLPSDEIAINSGLNMKTISNRYHSTTKEIVVEASKEHYEELYQAIQSLIDNEEDLNITLTLKLKGVSVDLSVNESLIVINTLAVKRAAIRGGIWSTVGKRVEKPLMLTLCKLYGVSEDNYKIIVKSKSKIKADFEREIDFYLCNAGKDYRCEVKLMGKGNPESADVVIARGSKVFVAAKLSGTNKTQFASLNIEWVELRECNGYKRFRKILGNLGIPHQDFNGDINKRLEQIFKEIFDS